MAATTIEAMDQRPFAYWLLRTARRMGGLALIALAVTLALALFSFTPTDPSINNASGGQVQNLVGSPGASTADIMLQLFGYASWLFAIAGLSWGIRFLLDKPLPLPWLPVLSLPLAILSGAAFLAARPVSPDSDWPYATGYGGMMGDIEFLFLQAHVSVSTFNWVTGSLALLTAILALGLRWREGRTAMGAMNASSRWVGRRLSGAAVSASAYSGQVISDGWKRIDAHRRARPIDAPVATRRQVASEPEELTSKVGRWVSGVAERLSGSHPPARDEAPFDDERPMDSEPPWDDDLEAEDEAPRPMPAVRRLRKRQADDEERVAPTLAEKSGGRPARTPQPAPPVAGSEDSIVLPDMDLLTPVKKGSHTGMSKAQLEEVSRQLETVLDDFGVRGEIIDAKPGPVVTLFELEPAPGTRAARVISLADDIARSLCALSVRVAVVPGRNVIGIELPNDQRETVYLRQLLESPRYASSEARLPLATGKDISGNPIIVDLARMPHLLIAGTTGSGKSVAINAMILSLLYRLTPEQCRIIMIDPKVIELSVYEDIPHLLAPVVTEPHKAVVALKWVVRQMDERYRLMSHVGVRDIFAYNRRIEQARARGEQLTRRVRTGFEPGTGQPIIEDQPIDMTPLPLIVVIVDEVADLMMTAGKEIENAIQRLSQKARAAGVHLIVATQRPSVDVLTGVIKANLPSRISFRVSSKIDSRTILGEPGAEQLLGQGDMLYMMPGDRIVRVHGPLVTDDEVERVVAYLRAQGKPDYVEEVTAENLGDAPASEGVAAAGAESGDALYDQAVQIVARDGKASTSYLQRKLSIGYNSAAKLIERMESEGLISAADHVGRRQVLMGKGGVDGTEPTDIDD